MKLKPTEILRLEIKTSPFEHLQLMHVLKKKPVRSLKCSGEVAIALLVFDRPPPLSSPKPMQNSFNILLKSDSCFKFP